MIGLIAAYAVALQTLLAAFAPLPANVQGAADFGALSIICFGSGNTGAPSGGPDAPLPSSGKFHCVVCCMSAGTAALPGQVGVPLPLVARAEYVPPQHEARVAALAPRAGSARAPPLNA